MPEAPDAFDTKYIFFLVACDYFIYSYIEYKLWCVCAMLALASVKACITILANSGTSTSVDVYQTAAYKANIISRNHNRFFIGFDDGWRLPREFQTAFFVFLAQCGLCSFYLSDYGKWWKRGNANLFAAAVGIQILLPLQMGDDFFGKFIQWQKLLPPVLRAASPDHPRRNYWSYVFASMSFIVNEGIYYFIILTVPLQLSQGEGLEFVKDCMALAFICTLDDESRSDKSFSPAGKLGEGDSGRLQRLDEQLATLQKQLATLQIDSDRLAPNAVKERHILDGAVKRKKIEKGAIDADRLATNAVTDTHICDDAVKRHKIERGAIDTDRLDVAAVTSFHMSPQRPMP